MTFNNAAASHFTIKSAKAIVVRYPASASMLAVRRAHGAPRADPAAAIRVPRNLTVDGRSASSARQPTAVSCAGRLVRHRHDLTDEEWERHCR